ncbi:hypothetical protein G3570_09115 [Balneolaceae bacterium YR4-1]|uniref:Uncharacterized protein n=1 Tax=Halalkalibaculum roseum TaxID=2709311 RepID=A0A6M1SN67_9BACT|nr:hypothetical protein [Halalkalibaculum roseum]NGP76791.1 hypothetical protein [Halalkalibaculum roseum]
MKKFTKYKFILFAILALNIVLVATHEGEFWPFSIFPMFSQAGNPWSRGVLERVENNNDSTIWNTKTLSDIRRRAVSLDSIGVDAIDYANFVAKTEDWNQKRIAGLRDLLNINEYPDARWMATRVSGYLTEEDSVVVEAVPLLLFTRDTTYKNPKIFQDK